jgi:predicted ATPase
MTARTERRSWRSFFIACAATVSQFIIATHSPILMAYPGATIFLLGDEAPRPIEFTETRHYQVTRAFLDHPDRMLRELMDAEADDRV